MNQPLTIDELQSIRTLMQSMLQEAESGNWQALDQLDAQRRELVVPSQNMSPSLQAYSTQNTKANGQDKSSYDDRCNEILRLDERITRTVLDAKQQLVKENRNMRNQVVAKNGYAQTATINTSFYNLK